MSWKIKLAVWLLKKEIYQVAARRILAESMHRHIEAEKLGYRIIRLCDIVGTLQREAVK